MVVPRPEDIQLVAFTTSPGARIVRCLGRNHPVVLALLDLRGLNYYELQPMRLSTGWSRKPYIWALAIPRSVWMERGRLAGVLEHIGLTNPNIHILLGGYTLCGITKPPGRWANEDLWVDVFEAGLATCHRCLTELLARQDQILAMYLQSGARERAQAAVEDVRTRMGSS